MRSSGRSIIVIALSFVVCNTANAMTGGEWYSNCSQWLHTTAEQKQTLSPERKVAYRACQIEAIYVFCDANYEGDSRGVGKTANGETKRQWTDRLIKVCPNVDLFNMPFGGPPVYAIRQIEKEGGMGVIESYSPASWALKRAFGEVFGSCQIEREKIGLYNDSAVCVNGWLKNLD
jgi:hypothetical protein